MLNGYLSYNTYTRRYEFFPNNGSNETALHCGYTLKVFDKNTKSWKWTRIELCNNSWYLVGTNYRGADLEGLNVRF